MKSEEMMDSVAVWALLGKIYVVLYSCHFIYLVSLKKKTKYINVYLTSILFCTLSYCYFFIFFGKAISFVGISIFYLFEAAGLVHAITR